MMMFAVLAFSQGVIFSLNDLKDPIRYIDEGGAYFIAVDGNSYRLGTPIHSIADPAEDMPQFSGKVGDCSNTSFKCRSIGFLKFAIPKMLGRLNTYNAGVDISVTRLEDGGLYASAICQRITRSGCVNQAVDAGPTLTYQYEVSKAGVLTSIKIQYWSDTHKASASYNLALKSNLGLNLLEVMGSGSLNPPGGRSAHMGSP